MTIYACHQYPIPVDDHIPGMLACFHRHAYLLHNRINQPHTAITHIREYIILTPLRPHVFHHGINLINYIYGAMCMTIFLHRALICINDWSLVQCDTFWFYWGGFCLFLVLMIGIPELPLRAVNTFLFLNQFSTF